MLLPYASDRPPAREAVAVACIVLCSFAIMGLVALISAVRGPDIPIHWYTHLGMVPASLTWYAPLTYVLLHQDVWHLSTNMAFLAVFGASVEDAVGWRRFLLLYYGGAVATGAVQTGAVLLLHGDKYSPIVGASGAVATIVGAFAVRFYRSRVRFLGLPFSVPAVMLVALVMLMEMGQALYDVLRAEGGLARTDAHWAHLAGFVLGVGAGHAMRFVSVARGEYALTDAVRARDRGASRSAISRLSTILARNPDDHKARVQLAAAWADLGDMEQAEREYLRAIAGLLDSGARVSAAAAAVALWKVSPETRLPIHHLAEIARVLQESGQDSDALETYKRLVAWYPDSSDAASALVRCGTIRLRRLGDYAGAVRDFERYLQTHPEGDLRDVAEGLLREARGHTGAGGLD